MFVKNAQRVGEQHAEQVISQSMGVRRPPKKAMKERSQEEPLLGLAGKPQPARQKPPLKQAHSRIEDSLAGVVTQNKKNPAKTPIKGLQKNIEKAEKNAAINPKAAQANDKLESIKITAPGTYELNLPSLFERDELIMAVKEGTYFIDLSSAFRKGKKE